jgi:cytochrome P450
MRQRGEEMKRKHQLISVSKEDLAWGFGRHACPGRFVANIVIKIMLAEFLLKLHVKNPEGAPRHKSIELDGQVSCFPY